MNPSRVAAVARRIAEGFRRDRRSLALLIVAPLVIVALLGWVLRDQKQSTVRVVVVNEAGQIGDRAVAASQAAAAGQAGDLHVEVAPSHDAAVEEIRKGEGDL